MLKLKNLARPRHENVGALCKRRKHKCANSMHTARAFLLIITVFKIKPTQQSFNFSAPKLVKRDFECTKLAIKCLLPACLLPFFFEDMAKNSINPPRVWR